MKLKYQIYKKSAKIKFSDNSYTFYQLKNQKSKSQNKSIQLSYNKKRLQMGNYPTPSHTQSLTLSNQQTKRQMYEADKLSLTLNLDTFGTSVIRRIFVQTRQHHLIKIIQKIWDKSKLIKFLEDIHIANIEILDSFYQHIVRTGTNQQKQWIRNNNMATGFDRQIGICGSSLIMKQKEWQPISDKYVNIIDLSKGTKYIDEYQKYKDIGLQSIQKQQVCFIILAGGKNMRYDMKQNKQCDNFVQLPSKSCLIQILLKKLQALGRLIDVPIHVYIMVDDEQHKKNIRTIKSVKIPNPEYIKVLFLTQINYGTLDPEGRLVINDKNQVFFHPNGSGDLWSNFQQHNIQKNGLKKFKYFQVFGVSNILQHCFDCFMLGKLVAEKRPWITIAVEKDKSCKGQPSSPAIFVNYDKTIQVRDPQEVGSGMDTTNLAYFPQNCPYIFTNNTIFSYQFIESAIKSQRWLEHRKYHCKHKKIQHRQPLSSYSSIFTFQRELTDIFSLTNQILSYGSNKIIQGCMSNNNQFPQGKDKLPMQSKGVVVLMNKQQYYAPFLNKHDIVPGIIALSQMFKKWLNIDQKVNRSSINEAPKTKKTVSQIQKLQYYEQKLESICQIDPFVSIEGQNLTEIIDQIAQLKGNISYPFYVSCHGTPESPTEHNQILVDHSNKTRFQKLQQFSPKF